MASSLAVSCVVALAIVTGCARNPTDNITIPDDALRAGSYLLVTVSTYKAETGEYPSNFSDLAPSRITIDWPQISPNFWEPDFILNTSDNSLIILMQGKGSVEGMICEYHLPGAIEDRPSCYY